MKHHYLDVVINDTDKNTDYTEFYVNDRNAEAYSENYYYVIVNNDNANNNANNNADDNAYVADDNAYDADDANDDAFTNDDDASDASDAASDAFDDHDDYVNDYYVKDDAV